MSKNAPTATKEQCKEIQYLINQGYKLIKQTCKVPEYQACNHAHKSLEFAELAFKEDNCQVYNINKDQVDLLRFKKDEQEHTPCSDAINLLYYSTLGLNDCRTKYNCSDHDIKLYQDAYQDGVRDFDDNNCWLKNKNS